MSMETFRHNLSRCLVFPNFNRLHTVIYWFFYYYFEVYSINFSKMIGNFLEVLNFCPVIFNSISSLVTTLNRKFSVVTTLPFSTLIFNSLTIKVRHKCATTFPTTTSLIIYFFHILTNTRFKHVTSTYYHNWYLVFEFTFNATYFYRVIDM